MGTNEQNKDTDVFVSNIGDIIEYLRGRNPDCCFVFVSPFYSNRREETSGNVKGTGALTSFKVGDHEDAMLEVENGTSEIITNSENIIVVPNFSYFESFMNNKTVFDHLSDCLNHPNDFGSNVYAQNILHTLGVIDDCAHTETYVKGRVEATCVTAGNSGDKVCSVCGHIVEAGTEIAALGHDWKLDREREVKYCSRTCGVEEIPVYIISFYGKEDKLLYEAVVDVTEDSLGYLSESDISTANAVAPYLYGYIHTGWDTELSTETGFESSRTVTAVYERDTAAYNTVVKDAEGNNISTEQVQFDQRFTVNSETAKSFLVKDQVVGGEGSVTLYGCGTNLEITASNEVAPEKISVAILDTVTDEKINGKNVYRVFVHVYNPTETEISKVGVLFAPGSVYTDDASFTLETLPSGKFATLSSDGATSDLLATFNGISNGVTRVVRAFAVADGTNIYSGVVDSHAFN